MRVGEPGISSANIPRRALSDARLQQMQSSGQRIDMTNSDVSRLLGSWEACVANDASWQRDREHQCYGDDA